MNGIIGMGFLVDLGFSFTFKIECMFTVKCHFIRRKHKYYSVYSEGNQDGGEATKHVHIMCEISPVCHEFPILCEYALVM